MSSDSRQDGKPQVPTWDCLVLSGGGSKAYGAGAARALDEYRRLRGSQSRICYVGTSAGALNAAVLGSLGAEALVQFWLELTPNAVLGARIRNRKFRGAMAYFRLFGRLFGRKTPYYLYPNNGLRNLIASRVPFEALSEVPVIIAATNYSTGRLEAFFTSQLIASFKDRDDAVEQLKGRRLQHLRRICSAEELADALLASSAYPVFYPPVEIAGSLYVDGGVGNHTPTREAAYFFRFLEELGVGTAGEVYCIRQDPPRKLEHGAEAHTLSRLLMRTLDVYHSVHTEPIVRAWFRINTEMTHLRDRVDKFTEWLDGQDLPGELRQEILSRVTNEVVRLGGTTARRQIEMIEIEPSAPLGDTFDFAAARIQQNITTGYIDMLKALREKRRIDDSEYQELSNRRLWDA